jgi:hypothetical protein
MAGIEFETDRLYLRGKKMRIGQFNRSISEILEDFSKPVPPHKLSQKDAYERDRQTGKSRKSGKKIKFTTPHDI